MSDIGFELDLFDITYKKATEANARGDIKAAKRYFLQASEIMRRVADKSPLDLRAARLERADKLKYIADNLCETVRCETESEAQTQSGGYKFLNLTKPNEKVTFDGIIGLDEAKKAIHRLLIDPLNNPQAYLKYGIKAGGFILLEGPPGTGKTTFAKAAASELGVPFAEVNANALVDSYIGKTGKNIDTLFAEARAHAKKRGTPVVLFIDELDFLAQKRSGDNKTATEAVPTLIKQMDGFSTSSDDLVLIAATNIKDELDPAVLSRFRNIINIPLPTESDREAMFKAKLDVLDEKDKVAVDFSAAAKASAGFSGRDITQVALEFKSTLAARDAGLSKIDAPLTELLLTFVSSRNRTK